MKKIFFCIIAAIVAMCVCSSCSNDDEIAINETRQSEFKADFQIYMNQQMAIINATKAQGMRKAASTDSTYSNVELLSIAQQLDQNKQEFIETHKDELQHALTGKTISEEEYNMMRLDSDLFLDYICENYSESVYNAVCRLMNGEDVYIDEICFDDLSVDEQFLIGEIYVIDQLGEMTNNAPQSNKPNYERPCKYAYDKARLKLDTVFLIENAASLGALISSAGVATPWSVISAAITYVVYVDNLNDLQNRYVDCLKNGKF